MKRLYWVLAVAGLLGLDVYFLGWRLAEVQGNVEAQFIIVTPAFVVSHVLHRRRADRHHAEQLAAVEQQHQERSEADAVLHRQVGELHDWHLRGVLPPDTLKP
ncbi:hypothetical protein [Streptacidiphilus sp. EB129]|uniref:hypothetical protein n=1 Tax=Streptacidiphilus sp. EB129 TaxID=3156262 RepID=UPI00351667CC